MDKNVKNTLADWKAKKTLQSAVQRFEETHNIKMGDATTDQGRMEWMSEGDVPEVNEVVVIVTEDVEGNPVGVYAAPGEYVFENGTVVVVGDEGVVTEVILPSGEVETEGNPDGGSEGEQMKSDKPVDSKFEERLAAIEKAMSELSTNMASMKSVFETKVDEKVEAGIKAVVEQAKQEASSKTKTEKPTVMNAESGKTKTLTRQERLDNLYVKMAQGKSVKR